jgi:hypothetical protein
VMLESTTPSLRQAAGQALEFGTVDKGPVSDNAKIENLQNHKTIFKNQKSHIPHTYSQRSCALAVGNRDYPVTPTRYTPMRCTPMRYACEVHAREMHAHKMHA